ncbi:hypothetical protein F7725_003368, partial [Dissostichus mawsoni]
MELPGNTTYLQNNFLISGDVDTLEVMVRAQQQSFKTIVPRPGLLNRESCPESVLISEYSTSGPWRSGSLMAREMASIAKRPVPHLADQLRVEACLLGGDVIQVADAIHVTLCGCHVQWRVVVVVQAPNVGTKRHQEEKAVEVTIGGCQVERRVPPYVTLVQVAVPGRSVVPVIHGEELIHHARHHCVSSTPPPPSSSSSCGDVVVGDRPKCHVCPAVLPQPAVPDEWSRADGDEDEMASGPPPLSTFTQPTPASPSHSSTRKRSAPVLATQPASKKLPSSAFYQLSAPPPQPGKGKASDTSVKPRKRGRGSSSSRTTEEELGWHNREENDQTPEPLNFTPARAPGPALDPTVAWSPLSIFRLFFSASVVHTIIANTNANALKRLQAGKKHVWKMLTVRDFYIFLSIIIFSGLVPVHNRSDYWRKKWPLTSDSQVIRCPGTASEPSCGHCTLATLKKTRKTIAKGTPLIFIVDLFGDLSTKNIGCCGTIRKNRVGFPQTELNGLPKKAERGDLRWIRKGKLLFIKWMDSREVTMCSTVHAAFSGQTVQRKVKQAGVWQTKTVPVPDAKCWNMLKALQLHPPPPPPPLTCGPMLYGEDASIRKYCRNCHDAGKKRVKTPWHC